ncbi:MAG: ATPase [Sphingomonadales bacterium]|nr:ATPase [Sphingomonadales bacterium]
MPQLSQIGEIYASQLFWLTIVFALIYFGIGRAMVPRIEATVDNRHAKITGDLAAAEAARSAADISVEQHRVEIDAAKASALTLVTDAKARGTASSEAQIKLADAGLATQIADAEKRIAAAKSNAMSEISVLTVDAVGDIVAKLSGVRPAPSIVENLVKAELGNV